MSNDVTMRKLAKLWAKDKALYVFFFEFYIPWLLGREVIVWPENPKKVFIRKGSSDLVPVKLIVMTIILFIFPLSFVIGGVMGVVGHAVFLVIAAWVFIRFRFGKIKFLTYTLGDGPSHQIMKRCITLAERVNECHDLAATSGSVSSFRLYAIRVHGESGSYLAQVANYIELYRLGKNVPGLSLQTYQKIMQDLIYRKDKIITLLEKEQESRLDQLETPDAPCSTDDMTDEIRHSISSRRELVATTNLVTIDAPFETAPPKGQIPLNASH